MKATFENTVDILVKAYLNDTLINGDCFACAVGNLVCSSLGLQMERLEPIYNRDRFVWSGLDRDKDYPGSNGWGAVFTTSGGRQTLDPNQYQGRAKEQIDSTGYTWTELALIEKTFEKNYRGDDEMLNGLMAVVDVLADIHSVDLSVKESAKAMFVKVQE